jgi:hypothetical protein
MKFEDLGTLSVITSLANSSLPVEGTIVRISGAQEENSFIDYSVVTDVDGITEKISLPAPSKNYSLSPGAPEIPYGIYRIEARNRGFYTKIIENVPVFSGINTSLPVNMIPSPIHDNNVEYPRNTLETIVKENENL